MSKIEGINVPMGIVPNDSQDRYPSHYAKYGHGGYRSAATLAEMQGIPAERLEVGCMCYVAENWSEYRWDGTKWAQEAQSGGAGGDKTFVYETYNSSDEWHIEHKLGKYPSVTVVEHDSKEEVIADVIYVDNNNVTVKLKENIKGVAYLN